MKKTPWFQPEFTPVREGLYETRVAGVFESYMRIWKQGSWWYDGGIVFIECTIQHRWWRGLQGDEHSLKIGANTYLVEFSEGPDRPYAED